MSDSVPPGKTTKAFLLSLLGGILIFVAGASRVTIIALHSSSVMPGVINAGYAMLQRVGEAGGYVFAAIAAISGVFVIIGAMMIHFRPAKASTWAGLVLAFSFVSFIGSGGFFFGAALGIVGGGLALTLKPNPPHTPGHYG
jgi:hypothetical protein